MDDEELKKLLGGDVEAPAGPEPVTSGAGVDELKALLGGSAEVAAPSAAPTQEVDLNALLNDGEEGSAPAKASAAQAPAPLEEGGLAKAGRLFFGGVKRNAAQLQATVPSIESMYAEATGDQEEAVRKAIEAKKVLDAAGESEYSLSRIHDPETFAYWVAEKLGEQSLTALTAMATGGAGAITTGLVTKQLLARGVIGSTTARLMQGAGTAVPLYAMTAPFEAANTSQEQFEVTGSPQAALSAGAGAVKGLLELVVPWQISRALARPGLQLAKDFTKLGLAKGIGKVSSEEALTEYAQEMVDIYARKVNDPNYSYFGSGPNWVDGPNAWLKGEGFLRSLEAGVTGGLVGGIFGAPFVAREQAQERKAHVADQAATARANAVAGQMAAGRGDFFDGGPPVPPMAGIASTQPGSVVPTLPHEMIANDKVEIEHEKGQNMRVVPFSVKSPYGYIDGKVDEQTKVMTIDLAGLGALRDTPEGPMTRREMKGKGHGAALYKALFDYALKNGYTVDSDIQVSVEASRVYQAMQKYGYQIEGPKGKLYNKQKPAEDQYFYSEDGPVWRVTKGPVSALREAVMSPQVRNSKLIPEMRSGKGDLLGVSAHLADLPGIDSSAREQFLNALDATTPRYVAVDQSSPTGFGSHVMTDTDVELKYSLGKQAERPQLLKVDQGNLQLEAITAHAFDLPSVESGRVWFLPKVSPAARQQLLAQYEKMQQVVEKNQGIALKSAVDRDRFEQTIRGLYGKLLDFGLRVVPSRGGGFYYNGAVSGEMAGDISSTGRTQQVGLFDMMTNKVTTFVDNEFSFQAYEQMHQAGLMAGTVFPVAIDARKIQPEDIEKVSDGYVLKKAVKPGMLVPGVMVIFNEVAKLAGYHSQIGRLRPKGAKTVVRQLADDPNSPYLATSKQMYSIVEKVLPVIDKILTSLGIDVGIEIRITHEDDSHGSLGIMKSGNAVMTLSPYLTEQREVGWINDLDALLLDIIMHELGHYVTYWHVGKMDNAVLNQLYYAWGKAKLATRMGPLNTTKRIGGAFNARGQPDAEYWLTFSEWLAEQFRREAFANPSYASAMEKEVNAGYKQLEKFYAAWDKEFGSISGANIRQPDYYFTAFLDLVRSQVARDRHIEKFMNLMYVDQDVLDSEALQMVARQVQQAYKMTEQMFPEGTRLLVTESLRPNIFAGEYLAASSDAVARYIYNPQKNLDWVNLALGALTDESYETRISHELWHAVETKGLVTPEEIALLMKDIKGREEEFVSAEAKTHLMSRIIDFATEHGLDGVWVAKEFEDRYGQELRAYYMQSFVDGKLGVSPEAKTIFERIMSFLEALKNLFQGLGFNTREDVIRAFYRGELSQRAEASAARNESFSKAVESDTAVLEARQQLDPAKSEVVAPGVMMQALKTEFDERYYFHDPAGNELGMVWIADQGPKGFEITMVRSSRPFFAKQMVEVVAKQKGQTLEEFAKPPSALTPASKAIMPRWTKATVWEGVEKYYVSDRLKRRWYSPNHIRRMEVYWGLQVNRMQATGQTIDQRTVSLETAKKNLAFWRDLKKRVPEQAWGDPRLKQMFSLRRNFQRDGTQGSIVRQSQQAEEAKLQEAMGQESSGLGQDEFTFLADFKQAQSRAENAKASGLPISQAAPSTMLTYEMRRTILSGYGNLKGADPYLKNLLHETERFGWFTKYAWTIDQLAQQNEGVQGLQGLQDYVQFKDLMYQIINLWYNRADTLAKDWRKTIPASRRDVVAQVFFDLAEMKYLPATATGRRLPTGWIEFINGQPVPQGSELQGVFRNAKLKGSEIDIIRQVSQIFRDFINEVEKTRAEVLQRTLANNPAALATALAKLQQEFAEYREKPYFPMTRFGKFIVRVREGAGGQSPGSLLHVSAYGTQIQRDAAAQELGKLNPLDDLTVDTIPADAHEFLSLPGPLLQAVKEQLETAKVSDPNISPATVAKLDEQIAWIEEFELINAPNKTFAKRWKQSKIIPGYSMDAFRAFSHYFMHGAKYLGRLKYRDLMTDAVRRVESPALKGNIGNASRRRGIAQYMRDHLAYIMEPGRDSGKFRALVSLWFLGFSPAAAGLNLTQPLLTLTPWLGGHFGVMQGYQGLLRALGNKKQMMKDPRFQMARDEMIRQQAIDVGQAAELGAYAEGSNLLRLEPTGTLERGWRQLGFYGMWMFQQTETFNRELSLRAAWELALKNPKAKRLSEISARFPLELNDLQNRVGLTHQEAVAFLFAKETIKRTQFEFDKSSDPPFMRGKYKKNFLIFFKYTHAMLYAIRYNGASAHMLLLMALLFGLTGLPFADEANELIRLVMKKLFGKDYDPEQHVREFVRNMTRGTVFDEVGPDTLLHGISRYGFGLGYLPQHYAIARFDASANGSMGHIVPGLAELMHGMAVGSGPKDVIAASAQRAAGAGYGMIFSLMNFMMARPASADGKMWEQLLPRQAKAFAKAWRYGVDPQAETTQGGARIAKFDPSDPDDIATVLAQAAGLTPTKVSETWEALREAREEAQQYQMRRTALYVQYDKALKDRVPQAIADVIEAIKRYNKEVIDFGQPSMAISSGQLRSALLQRQKARAMQEAVGTTQKRLVPVTRKILDLYPAVQERLKERR